MDVHPQVCENITVSCVKPFNFEFPDAPWCWNIYQHLPTFTLNITQFCSIILLYQHGAVLAWTATHQTTTHQNFQPKLQALQKALFVPLWSSAARPEIWGFKQEVKQSPICGIILADVLTVTSSLSLDLSSFFQLRLRQDVQSHCVDHGLVTKVC